jgi:DNA (cytosine-5)-methyltransferase 1
MNGQKLRVLDLFSGIGGFSLGLERAGGFETVAFCEIEPYCRRVLDKHWPGVPCYDDVRTFPMARGMADVVTAGFPCQDISLAGEGAGLAGARSGLWWKVRRTLRVVRPRFAVLENVAALLSRGMGTVLGSLAAIGYDAEWHCIPAGHVGASHERDRVWIIAHTNEAGRTDAEGLPGPTQQDGRQILTANHVGRRPHGRAAEPALERVVHGLSADVDAVGALGNAVVPQIPELIGRAIMQAEGIAA